LGITCTLEQVHSVEILRSPACRERIASQRAESRFLTVQPTIPVGWGGVVNQIPINHPVEPGFVPEQFPHAELASLQAHLDQLRARLWNAARPPEPAVMDEVIQNRLVKEILRMRRRREQAFGGGLFGEPAWDILLELYAAEHARQRLSVSSACYASGVPSTTALRWVRKLEKDGWIQRVKDPSDGRRSWVVLTEVASDAMRGFLSSLAIHSICSGCCAECKSAEARPPD
jgi:DNA-binding MarR family transcriptional regulator